MNDSSRQLRGHYRIGAGLLLGLLCALLVAGSRQLGWTEVVERNILDAMFRARGPQYPSPDVVIVVADDATVAKANGWPLPRRMYADVIRRLHRDGAKTIALDVVFSKKSHSLSDDAALAESIQAATSVVSATVFQLQADGRQTAAIDFPGDTVAPLAAFGLKQRNVPALEAIRAIGPRRELQRESVAVGHINAVPDSDGVLRRISHLIRFRDVVYPSLALAATSHFLDAKLESLELRDGMMVLPGRERKYQIPSGDGTGVFLNWAGATRSFPTFSFEQILSGAVPAQSLKGRIVLVGVTATAAFDHHPSPFSSAQPAVEVQANAINDILLQRILQIAPLWLQWSVLFLTAMICGAFMVSNHAWKSVPAAGVLAALFWVGALFLLRSNFYFPIAAPLLAILLTLGASLSFRQIRDARSLKLAEERYALAVQGANDGLWDWDLRTGRVYFSPRWQQMFGIEDEIGSSPDEWLSRVCAEDAGQLDADIQTHLDGHSSHLENEHRIRHTDGSYRWVLCRGLAVRGTNNKAVRMAGSLADITERRQNEEQLRFDALHDSLTLLPNRTFLMNLLEHAVEHKKRNPEYDSALFFLDIDQFKFVNDSLGHPVGDRLLVEIAARLKTCLRPDSTAVRLGGDEFAVLLETTGDPAEVSRLAQRLLDALAKRYQLDGQDVSSTASIGIVHNLAEYSRPENILRDAEIAMYRAKARGRCRYELFDADMHQQIVSRIKLESDLRRAIDRQEFELHYQPIVSLLSGKIAGFESLVRWQHPDGHRVAPIDFIPLAEETGLIIEMDLWSLERACRRLQQWRPEYSSNDDSGKNQEPLFISVNLSRKLFTLPDLVEKVGAILARAELDPARLKLEITESVMVENTQSAAATLSELKALGIQISIDDFGTGYSSLSYLHQFPLDVLKIDRSFIHDMESNEDKFKIVWTIIAMARNLGMEVVAEGVESGEQMEQLQSLTCDFGQGFFYSRPLPEAEVQPLLESNPSWLSYEQMEAAKSRQMQTEMLT